MIPKFFLKKKENKKKRNTFSMAINDVIDEKIIRRILKTSTKKDTNNENQLTVG